MRQRSGCAPPRPGHPRDTVVVSKGRAWFLKVVLSKEGAGKRAYPQADRPCNGAATLDQNRGVFQCTTASAGRPACRLRRMDCVDALSKYGGGIGGILPHWGRDGVRKRRSFLWSPRAYLHPGGAPSDPTPRQETTLLSARLPDTTVPYRGSSRRSGGRPRVDWSPPGRKPALLAHLRTGLFSFVHAFAREGQGRALRWDGRFSAPSRPTGSSTPRRRGRRIPHAPTDALDSILQRTERETDSGPTPRPVC